jgi:hypothetical protein
MKNLLSENMLRFGTKNLSEAAQRELVLKSVMETINEHGLHTDIRRHIMEQIKEDPAWLTTAKDKLAGENDYGYLSIGIIKAGSSYVMPADTWVTPLYYGQYYGVITKGSTWKPSTSLTVAYCPMKLYLKDDLKGIDGSPDVAKISSPAGLAQLAAGTYKNASGAIAKAVTSNAVWYPSIPETVCTAGGALMGMSLADNGDAIRTAMLAQSSASGQPQNTPESGKYRPKG